MLTVDGMHDGEQYPRRKLVLPFQSAQQCYNRKNLIHQTHLCLVKNQVCSCNILLNAFLLKEEHLQTDKKKRISNKRNTKEQVCFEEEPWYFCLKKQQLLIFLNFFLSFLIKNPDLQSFVTIWNLRTLETISQELNFKNRKERTIINPLLEQQITLCLVIRASTGDNWRKSCHRALSNTREHCFPSHFVDTYHFHFIAFDGGPFCTWLNVKQ